MGNCDRWYQVDFGKGPVMVRCTQTGEHAQCRTEVFHRSSEEIRYDGNARHNVFEE